METPNTNNRYLKNALTFFAIMAGFYYTYHNLSDLLNGISKIGITQQIFIYIGVFLLLFSIVLFVFVYKKINLSDSKIFGINIKKWFLIPFLFLSLTFSGITFFLLGNKTKEVKQTISSKQRIVLLLPLNEELKPSYEDGIRQLIGFAEYLKVNPKCTDGIEFALYDHSMNVDVAEDIIRKEMSKGTKYFISTMSKVNLPLSKIFPNIVSEFNFKNDKPKLICAVTSIPTIQLKQDLVYRYYVRSQEEAKALASLATIKNLKNATFVAVDDDYGKGAVEEFKREWKGVVTEGIFVKSTESVSDIENKVKSKISSLPIEQRQAIFICHYGNGIDNVITALYNSNIKSTILATSTLSIYEWQKPIRTILDRIEWYTCVPEYVSPNSGQIDVIKNFTTYSLEKFVSAISDTSFNYNWANAKSPSNLKVEYKDGDFIIPMRPAYKSEFNLVK